MTFTDVFAHMLWSSVQARYTAIALGIMVVAVSIGLMLARGVKPGVKAAAIVAFVIGVIPSVFFSLMQINCIVEGSGSRLWCDAYAWFISAVIILLSSLVVIAVTFAILEGKNIAEREAFEEEKEKANARTNKMMAAGNGEDAAEVPLLEGMENKDGEDGEDDEEEDAVPKTNAEIDKEESESVENVENFQLNPAQFASWN